MQLSSSQHSREPRKAGRRGGLSIVDGREHHHSVQFYESDDFLIRTVADHVAGGIADREPSIVIATPDHCAALARELTMRGVDVETNRRRGLFVELDARDTLNAFLVDGEPNEERFVSTIAPVLERTYARRRTPRLRAFGEMVDLLWADRNATGALALEAFWNRLAERYAFSLLCGYRMSSFDDASDIQLLTSICAEHTRVVPTERYVERDENSRALEITVLQQRAAALEAEIRRRQLLQEAMQEALKEREQLLNAEREARLAAERERRLAEQANRAKGEFLAIMSHELRTPLNAIAGYAELMELGVQGPISEAQRSALDRIQRSQRHLLGLINQVLNYARLETGGVRYAMANLPLAASVRAADALVFPQMQAKGLRYSFEGCDPALCVRADSDKLQQILLNLFANATKFTDRGGTISVDIESAADVARVRMRDTGVGIPTDKLSVIFDPFVQVDSQYTRTRDGVGLGLAISRDLARGMRGDLTVESTLNVGSVFTLTLPLAPPQ